MSMKKTRTAAQRYNARMDEIFAKARELQTQCKNCKILYHKEFSSCPRCQHPTA